MNPQGDRYVQNKKSSHNIEEFHTSPLLPILSFSVPDFSFNNKP